jgi:hypothetical protein
MGGGGGGFLGLYYWTLMALYYTQKCFYCEK